MAAQLSAVQYVHHAPSGTRYQSILDAGLTMLRKQCNGFLQGTSNTMLPPIFTTSLPEQVGVDGAIIPGPSINPGDSKLKGVTNNKRGEDLEALVFRRFEQLLHPRLSDLPLQDCQILWQGLKINGFKVDALLADHPHLQQRILDFRKTFTTKNATTFGEADIVVLVKNVGLVVLEIKRSLPKVKDGKKQSRRMAEFASILFESCSPGIALPVAKVVVVGEAPESLGRTAPAPMLEKDEKQNVWVLYEEAIRTSDHFEDCWKKVLDDLHQSVSPSNGSSVQFETLAANLTALWCMVGFNGLLSFKGMFDNCN